MEDFRKYAVKHLGLNSQVLNDVVSAQNQYLNPYILEERQLNVTQMDVFSRLMMDRIIFLGTQIDDYTANTLQAQLLYLDSVDPGKDISIVGYDDREFASYLYPALTSIRMPLRELGMKACQILINEIRERKEEKMVRVYEANPLLIERDSVETVSE